MTFLIHCLIHSAQYQYKKERKKVQLHRPTAHFSSYQRGVYYARIKIFNRSPASIAESVKDKKRSTVHQLLKCF